ncbi:hypothetical protein [Burkholderia sp. ABCPW 14]|uniref:hypothetical protein n=1 Tax=Burkholderia sp. ABCPW 14 TaxID=1637860 RepID=UPI0012E3E95A|nr:hypothetical protein [Burkholderia sp. ABCPW 14]
MKTLRHRKIDAARKLNCTCKSPKTFALRASLINLTATIAAGMKKARKAFAKRASFRRTSRPTTSI